VGDPITFVLNEDLVVATHRVIAIDAEKQHFYTKGDANETEDANPVLPGDIVGLVRFSIPQLGFLVTYIQSPPGTYVAISAAALLLLLSILTARKER